MVIFEGISFLSMLYSFNFIQSCNNKNGFLVTQMPLDSTVVDFWRMIYEKDCLTIVSLTSPDALAASQV